MKIPPVAVCNNKENQSSYASSISQPYHQAQKNNDVFSLALSKEGGRPCPLCDGTGMNAKKEKCSQCAGHGWIPARK